MDINDLTIVLAHYNDSVGVNWGTGDFTGSGKVDINDLTIVLAHYNQSVGATSAEAFSAVPEPSTLLLVAAGLVGLLGYAWRRAREVTERSQGIARPVAHGTVPGCGDVYGVFSDTRGEEK